jgi:hypothetical protein
MVQPSHAVIAKPLFSRAVIPNEVRDLLVMSLLYGGWIAALGIRLTFALNSRENSKNNRDADFEGRGECTDCFRGGALFSGTCGVNTI